MCILVSVHTFLSSSPGTMSTYDTQILVSKYHSLVKKIKRKNQASRLLGEVVDLELQQRKYKTSLEHPVPEIKEMLRNG